MILDASVVVKLFLPENGTDKAYQVIKESSFLAAPEIIIYEVVNAFVRYLRMGSLSEEIVTQLCKKWRKLILEDSIYLTSTKEDVWEARDLSIKFRHPIQDCLYLRAAQKLVLPIATADKKMAEYAKILNISVIYVE